MNEAQALAEKLAALIFPDSEVPSEAIPYLALSVVANVPCLKAATEAECQFIFHEICGALAARSMARIVQKSARFIQ
jgi:hypothetical protein